MREKEGKVKARRPSPKEIDQYASSKGAKYIRKQSGKGDKPRPVKHTKYRENFDNIFGEKPFPWEKKIRNKKK